MKHEEITPAPALDFRLLRLCVLASLAFLFPTRPALAAPVSADVARNAVQGWLRLDGRPLGARLSARIKNIQTVKDAGGLSLYHVVQLEPAGYVILAADDLADPIIAFSASGRFDPAANGGVAFMVNRDLPRRMARARAGGQDARARRARRKWQGLEGGSPNPPPDSDENGNVVAISQVWVAPFLPSLWNQTTDQTLTDACYNYYTPPNAAGDVDNYPCGCVATAMAQIMYYFRYPSLGVGTSSFSITNDGVAMTAQLLGGDGQGGPYQWTNMPAIPSAPGTAQAQAVGALCSDAGLTVNMNYAEGGSDAYFDKVRTALTTTFMFSNSAYDENDLAGLSGTNLLGMINPNLDARLPLILGIEPAGGHCLVCDGYGYSASTLFHHLNAGWGGDDDLWYALPAIDTSDNGDFTLVVSCEYNLFTNGSGQIISGRVTDPSGAPSVGAIVTAVRSAGGTYSATTDTNGIYALARIPAASKYTLTATNVGTAAASANYSTGTSSSFGPSNGNVWGANFVLSPPLLALPESGFAAVGPSGGPFTVSAQAYSLTNSSAESVGWTLANTPSWLDVSAGSGTVTAGAADSLTISLNAAAGSLAAGTHSATVWITNLNNNLAQALPFSVTVITADSPIPVTGFNDDVVVENTAVGGNAPLYADLFDGTNTILTPPASFSFYELGLSANNIYGDVPAVKGLPAGGFFTSAADNATTFQLGPYAGDNVLYLWNGATSGTLTLTLPLAYQSLSVLAASSEGGGNGALTLHFTDNSSSSAIAFKANNYFTTNTAAAGAALTAFGVLVSGNYNEYYVFEHPQLFPAFYQTSINLKSLGLQTKPIQSITFTMPADSSAATVTGVFAVSGTESPDPVILSQPASVAAASGSEVELSVAAAGAAPLTYRWLFNGAAIAGTQGDAINIGSAGVGDAGNYRVIVTNNYGAVTSVVASLSLTNVPPAFTADALQFSGGNVILQLTNLTQQGPVMIAASTNLLQWYPIFTNPSGFGTFSVTDSAAGSFSSRFYRAATP
jgi:hypothetical protein